jgi:hypothetical protein
MTWSTIALGLAILFASVFLGGLLLPATREGTAARTIDAPPELVRAIMLDVASQPTWRAGVSAIRQEKNGEWTEITKHGEEVTLRLHENTETTMKLSFESTRGYTGAWKADISPTPSGATNLIVQEQATTLSPVGRIIAFFFFDTAEFAKTYLDELAARVARLRNAAP